MPEVMFGDRPNRVTMEGPAPDDQILDVGLHYRATGPARLVLDCVSGAAGSCGVRGANYLPSGDSVTVAMRLRVVTGDNSNQTRVVLSLGQDASNNVNLIFFTDGSIECGATVSGSYTYWRIDLTGYSGCHFVDVRHLHPSPRRHHPAPSP